MGVRPPKGLVVQLVELHSATGGGAKRAYQMLYPLLLQTGGVIYVVGIDIVVSELRAVAGKAVAAVVPVRMHVGVGGLLCPVHRNGEAAVPRREFVDKRNDRDRDQ